MEEMMIMPSSPSPIVSISQEFLLPTAFQQRLQFIVQSQPDQNWWVYSILWHAVKDPINGHLVLSWGGGHYRGNKSLSPKTSTKYDPCCTERVEAGCELFYTLSSTKSYGVDDGGVLGRALVSGSCIWLKGIQEITTFDCERVREAQMNGIETLVCVSTSAGVVELCSSCFITEDWNFVQLVKSVFGNSPGPSIGEIPNLNVSNSGMQQQLQYLARSSSCDYDHPNKFDDIVPKRGRKAILRGGENNSPIEAERRRRQRLNSRFYALRSVVPTISKMDKASLLADAVTYIKELKTKIDEYEATLKSKTPHHSPNQNKYSSSPGGDDDHEVKSKAMGVEVDVKVLEGEALIRVQCPDVNYPSARLMNVLRDLKFQVHHASISTVKDLVLQDVVVKVPHEFTASEEVMGGVILKRLMEDD